MSTVAVFRRHPLGLPAGSVRSMLLVLVAGLVCILILQSPNSKGPVAIPPYLIYLLFLIVGSFFSAHGTSIAVSGSGEPSPLYLPRGTIRFLILVGLIATVVWKLTNRPETWEPQVQATVDLLKNQTNMPLVILGSFFLGAIIRAFLGRNSQSILYQDLLAWVALIAMCGMVISILLDTLIKPSLEQINLDLVIFESILAGIVAFYFAARS